MRADRVGPLLLVLGLVVGGAAGIGLLTGFEPAQLPRALLNIAAYKLTFLAAGGLLAAGALLVRHGRRSSSDHPPTAPTGDARHLGEGLPPQPSVEVRERDARA